MARSQAERRKSPARLWISHNAPGDHRVGGHCGEGQTDRQRHTPRISCSIGAKGATPEGDFALTGSLPQGRFAHLHLAGLWSSPSTHTHTAPATVPKQRLLGNGLLLTAPKAACTLLPRGKQGCPNWMLGDPASEAAERFTMADLENTASRALSEHVGHAKSRSDFGYLTFHA